jgi:hypothetical protein
VLLTIKGQLDGTYSLSLSLTYAARQTSLEPFMANLGTMQNVMINFHGMQSI